MITCKRCNGSRKCKVHFPDGTIEFHDCVTCGGTGEITYTEDKVYISQRRNLKVKK